MNARAILALCAVALACALRAQTPQTRADLYTEVDAQLASSQKGGITAAQIRTVLKDVAASTHNPLTDGSPVVTSGAYANPAWLTSLHWSKLTSVPTSIAGLGVLNGAALDAIAANGGGYYLARANHTGTQASATISDFASAAAAAAPVQSVAGRTGAITLAKADVGLASVDNTSDAAKPISSATQAALDAKANTSALGTAAALNVPATGNAASGEVVKGTDTRLSDARTPTTHTHTASQLSDSTATGRSVLTATDAAAARSAIGAGTSSFDGAYSSLSGRPTLGTAAALDVPATSDATSGQVVKGTDSRLTDSRAPTAHTHAESEVTNLVSDLSSLNSQLSTKEPAQTAVSQAEAEAGTSTGTRSWTPQRVAQAIAALAPGGGSGTVTSFSAGDLSPLFTTSEATPTTTPALTFALNTQIANKVFAGPTTGADAAPTFRTLVAADIPSLTLAKISDAGALAALATVGTAQIDADAVTYAKIQNVSATNRILGRITAGAGDIEELTAANVKTILALTSSDVSLGSVTNDAQTKAAVVPNTAPSSGQILVGNAGGTAYAPQSVSGDGTLSSAGALIVTKTNSVSFAASATTDATNAANIGSGTLPAGRLPALTGDVTTTAGSAATTLANIPSGTPMAGSALATAVAAPATPAAGKASIYVDSTSKNLAAKNDAGTVNHGVQTRAASASNWIRSIADDGSTTISQPAFSDVSGSVAATQMPALTGDVTTSAGAVSTTLATVNSNVGTFGSATAAAVVTVNAKGLVTAASNTTITPAATSLTGTLNAAQMPAHTGDVTSSSGSVALTLANVPVGATYATDLTAQPKNDGGWSVYRVSGSNATNTNATLTTITGLTSGTLSNSTLYEFEASLKVGTSGTAGCKWGVTCAGSGTAATVNAVLMVTASSTTGGIDAINAIDTANTTAYLTTSAQDGYVFIRGFITTRGSGTATVSIQNLKVTSGTATTYIGSIFRIRKA